MEADCLAFGCNTFSIWFRFAPVDELDQLEIETIMFASSLEQQGGYNKSLGRLRAIAARIRDTEIKLQRARKLIMLPSVENWQRLKPTYLRFFCQKDVPLYGTGMSTGEINGCANQQIALDPAIWTRWSSQARIGEARS